MTKRILVVDTVGAGPASSTRPRSPLVTSSPATGWDRIGMMYEAKGENKTAADCYRKALEIIRERPQQYDPEFGNAFVELIDKLDPPTARPTT
jgi:hypothetical protein